MKETREAISAVANDDGALAELCLTERHGDETPWCDPCPLRLVSMTGEQNNDAATPLLGAMYMWLTWS